MKRNFFFLAIALILLIYQQGLKDSITTLLSLILVVIATVSFALLLWRLMTGKWDMLQRIRQCRHAEEKSPEEMAKNEKEFGTFTVMLVGKFLLITCALVTIVALFLKILTFYKTRSW